MAFAPPPLASPPASADACGQNDLPGEGRVEVEEAPQPVPEEECARPLLANGPPFLFVDRLRQRDDCGRSTCVPFQRPFGWMRSSARGGPALPNS